MDYLLRKLYFLLIIVFSILPVIVIPEPTQYVSYGHRGRVLSLAINDHGSILASAGDDQDILVWNFQSRSISQKLTAHSSKIQKLKFLSDDRLCSVDQSGHIIIWNLKTKEILFQWTGLKNTITTDLDAQGHLLVTSMDNGKIRLFDLLSRHHIGDFQIDLSIIWCIAISLDGRYLAIGTEDGKVILWQIDLRKIIATSSKHNSRVWTIDFHPTDHTIVSGSWSGDINFWQPSSKTKEESVFYGYPILQAKFSPSGNLVAIGTAAGSIESQLNQTLRLMNFHSRQNIISFHKQTVHDLAITRDGEHLLAAGDQDGSVVWWSTEKPVPVLFQPSDGKTLSSPEKLKLSWDAKNLYSVIQVATNIELSNPVQMITPLSSTNLRIKIQDQPLQILRNEISIDPASTYWWRVKSGNFNHVGEWSQTQMFHLRSTLSGRIRISPKQQSVKPGEDFTIAVWIELVKDLDSFQFDIKWSEPTAIHFITTTYFNEVFPKNAEIIGTIRSQLQKDDKTPTNEPFFQIDRQLGLYKNIIAVKSGEDYSKPNGRLIQILCRAKKKGVYQFSLENLVLLDQSLTKIPVEIIPAQVLVDEKFQPWDVNVDGIVDIFDLSSVARCYGKIMAWDYNPDVNRDGEVNIFDLTLIAKHFGQSYQSTETFIELLAPFQFTSPITEIGHNYPNPFNPETWIPFQLAHSSNTSILIYSLTGQLIRRLNLGYLSAGSYLDKSRAAHWNGRNTLGEPVPSGIYFYTLNIQDSYTEKDFSKTKKMVVVR